MSVAHVYTLYEVYANVYSSVQVEQSLQPQHDAQRSPSYAGMASILETAERRIRWHHISEHADGERRGGGSRWGQPSEIVATIRRQVASESGSLGFR